MSNPEAALEVVESISEESLHTSKQTAKYSLLHTMAIDRSSIDTTDMSLLVKAIDYYSSHGPLKDKVYTLYYEGRLLYNSGNYLDAIVSFHDALIMSERMDDSWIKGMICSYLGITYNKDHLVEASTHYFKLALDYYNDYGDSLYVDNTRALLASALHGIRMFEASDSVALCIDADSRFHSSAILTMASNEVFRNDMQPDKAVALFKQACDEGAYFFPDEWYQYAYALTVAGESEKANVLIAKLKNVPQSAKTLWWQYKIAAYNQDTSRALSLLESYNGMVGTTVGGVLSQSLYKAESEHYQLVSDNSRLKEAAYRNTAIFIAIAMFLVILAAISLVLFLKTRNEYELQQQENRFSELQRMLELACQKESTGRERAEDKLLEIRRSYAKLYRRQLSEIGRMYEIRERSTDALEQGYLRYAKKVSEFISILSSGEREQQQFESIINKHLDEIMICLRNDFPVFSSDTFRFISYWVAGFDSFAIAAILGCSPNTVRSRKARLRSVILDSETPNRALYEAYMA